MSTIMTHKRLCSAFLKAGYTVTQQERRGNPSFIAKNPKNGKAIRKDMINDCALDIVEANYGITGKRYRMNHRGEIIA